MEEGCTISGKLFGFYERKTLDIPGNALERINNDLFLSTLYRDELSLIRNAVTIGNPKRIIEIGAAGGNTKILWPEVETTDVRPSPGVDKIMSAENIEVSNGQLDVIFGLDALHHVRDPKKHFEELRRVLRPGGNAIYIEPNWNIFSRICFQILLKYLHPEPFNTKQKNWNLQSDDPMMGNQAQASNIFVRDKEIFKVLFPDLKVEVLGSLKGVAFLLSGGVHTRLPIPSKLLLGIYRIENRNMKWLRIFGLGRLIRITKTK